MMAKEMKTLELHHPVIRFLNCAAVGWAVSCSTFGLLIFFFSFVGEQTQTPTRLIVITR